MEQIRSVKSHYLYNMLQDFRHVLVFDLRDQKSFLESEIRDAFNLYDGIKQQNVQEVVDLSIKKANQKQKKYAQLKKVRRYFFVNEQSNDLKDINAAQTDKIQLTLSAIPKQVQNKFYFLSGGYKQYYNLYPFTCLIKAQFDKLQKQGATQLERDKLLLYPYCRFPTEIIQGKLYLGNVSSSNSQRQLKDLKIKGLVDFIEYTEDNDSTAPQKNPIPAFKNDSQKYDFLQLPFNKNIPVTINFDIICSEIDQKVNKGPVLLYCEDGESISAAFSIAYLMYKANLDVSMATLKVCQAISRTDITKWIYTQLLVYKPKKKQIDFVQIQN